MKNRVFLLAGVAICLLSCGRRHGAGANERTLTCLILGYDSIIYYVGSSEQMQDVHTGKITDDAFVSAMFEKIKGDGLAMVIKPGGGGDMATNFQQMVSLANYYNVHRRSVDSGDINEDKAFGFSTPPVVKAAMRGEDEPVFHLDLPRDEGAGPGGSGGTGGSGAVSGFPKGSQLVIFLAANNDIFACMGGDLRNCRKYTSQEITGLLKAKSSDKRFSVVIKPTEEATYQNTVDMLDAMAIANIKHYALVDITKQEREYLKQMHQ